MESHSYSSSTSSSSSSPYHVSVYQYQEGQGKGTKPHSSSHESSLQAVGRVPKPMTKKPIAPFPPTPPKIYKVEAENFKEIVQMLTTAPGFQSNSRRLQEVAPPPLDLKPKTNVLECDNNASLASNVLSDHQIISERTHGRDIHPTMILSPNILGGYSPLGFAPLSPSSFAWWASNLPSPGTLSSLEASAVL